MAFQQVPGTPFGLALVPLPATVSGPATASLAVGIGSVLVSFVVGCFGLAGVEGGWGPMVAGAFAALSVIAGLAALGLGGVGLRQVRRTAGPPQVTAAPGPTTAPAATTEVGASSWLVGSTEATRGAVRGQGLAVAGMICGGGGVLLTMTLFLTALLLAV